MIKKKNPRINIDQNLQNSGRARAKNTPRKVFTRLRLQNYPLKCRLRPRTIARVDPYEGYVVQFTYTYVNCIVLFNPYYPERRWGPEFIMLHNTTVIKLQWKNSRIHIKNAVDDNFTTTRKAAMLYSLFRWDMIV